MRTKLVITALAAGGLLLGASSLHAQGTKNVILMISDGGGFNAFRATDLYTGLTPVYESSEFKKFGMQTFSASRPVAYDSSKMFNGTDAKFAMSNYTDSASAATAMYTGVKNYDGEVNWSTDDKPLTTYFELAAKIKDRSIGAISSVEFSHATPASVYGHNSSRNNYAAIGYEGVYGSNPVDNLANSSSNPRAGDNNNYDSKNYYDNLTVLMGAGSGDHNDNGQLANTTDQYVGGSDAWADIKQDGAQKDWSFAHSKQEFEAVANGSVAFAPGKLLGVAQVNTTLQQARSNPAGNFDPLNSNVPTLEVMTRAGLNVLAKNNNGFAVMIEGGAVDWAAHANQRDRIIEEQIDFNNSVKAVVDFVDRGGDDIDWTNTLLIVTADHETGNLWGNGSFTDLNGNARYDAGIDAFNGYQTIDGVGADVLADMQWLSGDHTNAIVPLFARGAGSELFANYVVGYEDINAHYGLGTAGFSDGLVGYIDNTSIHSVMSVASAVPEPGSVVLLGLAFAAVTGIHIRNRRRANA